MGTRTTIGDLARLSGVSVEAIRYYEREGLLPKPERSPSRYRLYVPADVERVLFIRRGQSIGLTLDDLRELLRLHELKTPEECRRVAARLESRIQVIEEKITALRRFRSLLTKNLERCRTAESSCCPVTIDLAGESAKAGARVSR